MEFSIYLLVLGLFFKISSCIRCFQCEENESENKLLCKHFDGSDKFITDCDHSTMCHKRNTTMSIGNGVTVTNVKRGCAQQIMDGDQKRINGKWRRVYTPYEVYEEGCKKDTSDADRIPESIDCYCRGHLCNTSSKHRPNLRAYYISLLGIIYVIS